MEQRPTEEKEKSSPKYYIPEEPSKPKMGLMQILLPVAIAVVLSFFIMPMAGGSTFVKIVDDKNNYQSIMNSINGLKAELDGVRATINSVSGLPAQVGEVNASLNALSQEIATLKTNASGYAQASIVAEIDASLTALQEDVNALVDNVGDLSSNEDIKKLTDRITALEKEVDDLTATEEATSEDIYGDIDVTGTIQLPDVYNATITLYNETASVVEDASITLILTSASSSTAVVDAANSSVFSIKPILNWGNARLTSWLGATRRVTFDSESFDIPANSSKTYKVQIGLAYMQGSTDCRWTPDVFVNY